MGATLVTFHVGESLAPAYEAALEGAAALVRGPVGGLSSAFEQLAEAPLEEVLAEIAPAWSRGDPLVLLGYSAGCFAIRRWLNEDRGVLSMTPLGIVLLDGLHGGGGPACFPPAIRGVIDFAAAATEDPQARLLINTSTDITPPYSSTSACAEKLLHELARTTEVELEKPDAGRAPGVYVLDYGGTDAAAHARQVQVVGPEIVRTLVTPWLRQARDASRLSLAPFVVLLGIAGVGYALATRNRGRRAA